MVAKAIDYERDYDPGRPGQGGVIIGVHKVLNMDIYMYANDPGIYLNAYGKRVPSSMAEAAGFDIKMWEAKRKKKAAFASFAKSQEAAEATGFDDNEVKVLAEHEGFKLIELPQGRATIIDPEGNPSFPPNSMAVVKEAFEAMYRALGSEYEEELSAEEAELKAPRTAAQRRGAKPVE